MEWNFICIWYFNRNLLAVFYKTHLTFCLSFSSSTYYTSESVNMADIKNYSNPEEVHNKYYNSQKMMLGEKNMLDLEICDLREGHKCLNTIQFKHFLNRTKKNEYTLTPSCFSVKFLRIYVNPKARTKLICLCLCSDQFSLFSS